jgi:hypothetical protein
MELSLGVAAAIWTVGDRFSVEALPQLEPVRAIVTNVVVSWQTESLPLER